MKDKITSFFIKTGFFSREEVVKLRSKDGTCMQSSFVLECFLSFRPQHKLSLRNPLPNQ